MKMIKLIQIGQFVRLHDGYAQKRKAVDDLKTDEFLIIY